MSATLVIMAAGLASRYGGVKQIEKVGPAGEILMEYTIHDAAEAGFDKFVIILRPEMLEDFREVCGDRLEKYVHVEYAFQDFADLPGFYTMPEGRVKPYGTVSAVLAARKIVDGPFAAANADDYYGKEAFRLMYAALQDLPESGRAVMVAYRLKNTVSEFGAVTRGVCTVADGEMKFIRETYKITLFPDGSIRSMADGSEEGVLLDGESAVSMNFWGFSGPYMQVMEQYFEDFLRSDAGLELKSECLLPTMVGEQVDAGTLKVTALTSDDCWFGMTYKEDRADTSAHLKALTEAGEYPVALYP